MQRFLPSLALGFLFLAAPAGGQERTPGTWPLFGGTPFRNMANTISKGIPAEFEVLEGDKKLVRWVATLGTKCYGGPVVAGGKIYVGTNNANPRDPKVMGHKAILMAFSEKDGKFLWQIAHDIPDLEIFGEVRTMGLLSTPVVEGDRLYYVTPGAEAVCASTDGKVLWRLDMLDKLKVHPFHCSNCSPLVYGDHVFLITGNGTDEDGKVAHPKAPSFLALNKKDGTIAWQSDLPGTNIVEGQWSNPTLVLVNGKAQIVFPGGDTVLYGLEPATGKMIWKCNLDPQRKPAEGDMRPFGNYFVSTPVFHDGKLYIGLGLYPENPHPDAPRFSFFACVDPSRTGDVSPKNMNAADPQNKNSALVWAYGGPIEPRPKRGRPVHFGRTISTAAVHDGIVYISEESGYLHCLDARNGKKLWEHDYRAGVWGSPYYVDGKIFQGVEDGLLWVFAAGRTHKALAEIDFGETIHGTPVAVGSTLYVATRSKLYAIGNGK